MRPPLLSGQALAERWRAIQPYVRGRLLDIGCGLTPWTESFQSDQVYVGVDINKQLLAQMRQRYPHHEYIQRDLDVEDLGLAGRQFDTIIMTAVLEHLHQPRRVVTAARSLLAPNGVFLATTPSPWGDIVHRLGSRVNLFYAESVVKHIKIFNRIELLEMMTQCGYEVVKFKHFAFGMNQLLICRRTDL